MMRIYLAGGMRSNWRDEVKAALPYVTFIDPCDHGFSMPSFYTAWDNAGVERADVVLAYLEDSNPSGIGLAYEIGKAVGMGKKVILVDEKDNHYTQILRESVDLVCESMETAIFFLTKLCLVYL